MATDVQRTEQKAAAGSQSGVEAKVARLLSRVKRVKSIAQTKAAGAQDPTFIEDLNSSIQNLHHSEAYSNRTGSDLAFLTS